MLKIYEHTPLPFILEIVKCIDKHATLLIAINGQCCLLRSWHFKLYILSTYNRLKLYHLLLTKSVAIKDVNF